MNAQFGNLIPRETVRMARRTLGAMLTLAVLNPVYALTTNGVISNIKGQVVVKEGDDSKAVVQESDIVAGNVIITFDNSSVQLILGNCKIDIGPNSFFAVREFSNCNQARKNIVAIDPTYMPKSVNLTPARIKSKKAIKDASRDVGKLFDEPGVLTARGKWTVEPSLAYSHSTATRVAIEGLSVLPALAIGLIDVSEVQRNTVTGTVGFRYGVTNRIEVGGSIPYTYKEESNREREVGVGTSGDGVNGTTGAGIGDIGLSLGYQISDVKPGKPYFLGNIGVKSRTGLDPFQVKRSVVINQEDGNVIGEELLEQPTGSGFWSVSPSITMVYPTEPSVLFGNLSYTVNLGRDVGESSSGTTVGYIDPGDVLGFNFGVGFSVNPRTSFSLGYSHSIVGKTETEGSSIEAVFDTIHIGSLLVGISHVTQADRNLSLSLGIGATDQSTDVQLSVKTPFNL